MQNSYRWFPSRHIVLLKVWICVTCSYSGCDEKNHTLNHFKALRTGTQHPLFFAVEGKQFR